MPNTGFGLYNAGDSKEKFWPFSSRAGMNLSHWLTTSWDNSVIGKNWTGSQPLLPSWPGSSGLMGTQARLLQPLCSAGNSADLESPVTNVTFFRMAMQHCFGVNSSHGITGHLLSWHSDQASCGCHSFDFLKINYLKVDCKKMSLCGWQKCLFRTS